MKNANEVQMNLNSPAAQAMCNTAAGADVRDCGFLYLWDQPHANHEDIKTDTVPFPFHSFFPFPFPSPFPFPLPFGYSGSTTSPSLSLEP